MVFILSIVERKKANQFYEQIENLAAEFHKYREIQFTLLTFFTLGMVKWEPT